MASYFGRRVLRVRHLEKHLAEILQNEINEFLPLENVSALNNEVDVYTPFQMKHKILNKMLEVLIANAPSGKIFTLENIEVKSTIVIVTNIPNDVHAGYMDEFMSGFGKLLTKFQLVKVGNKSLRYGWIVYEDLRSAEKCIHFLHTNTLSGCFMNAKLLPEDITSEASLLHIKTIQVEGFPPNFTEKEIRKFFNGIFPDWSNTSLKFVTIKRFTENESINQVTIIDFDSAERAIESFSKLDNSIFPFNEFQSFKFKAYFALPGAQDFEDACRNMNESIDRNHQKTESCHIQNYSTQTQPLKNIPMSWTSSTSEPVHINISTIQSPTTSFNDMPRPHFQNLESNPQPQLFHSLPLLIRPGLPCSMFPASIRQNIFPNMSQNSLQQHNLQQNCSKFQQRNFKPFPLERYPFQHPVNQRPLHHINLQENLFQLCPLPFNPLQQQPFQQYIFHPLHLYHTPTQVMHQLSSPQHEKLHLQHELVHLEHELLHSQYELMYPPNEQMHPLQKIDDEQIFQNCNNLQPTANQQEDDCKKREEREFFRNQCISSNSQQPQNRPKLNENFVKNSNHKPHVMNEMIVASPDVIELQNNSSSNQSKSEWNKKKTNSRRWSERKKIDCCKQTNRLTNVQPSIAQKTESSKTQQKFKCHKEDGFVSGSEFNSADRNKIFYRHSNPQDKKITPNSVGANEDDALDAQDKVDIHNKLDGDSSHGNLCVNLINKFDVCAQLNEIKVSENYENKFLQQVECKTKIDGINKNVYLTEKKDTKGSNDDNESQQNNKSDRQTLPEIKDQLHDMQNLLKENRNKEDVLLSLLEMSILDASCGSVCNKPKSYPLDIQLDDHIENSRLLSFMRGICHQKVSPNKMFARLF